MTSLLEPLALDTDPEAYLDRHHAADESVSDNLLTGRELEIRNQIRQIVATDVAPRAAELDRPRPRSTSTWSRA